MIIFENKGEIDPRLITLIGVNIKPLPNVWEADVIDHRRDDLDYLPSDCELPCAPAVCSRRVVATEAPAVADVGHLPRLLYGIDSNRPRWQIIADYAREHRLTMAQIDDLVRQLPDYRLHDLRARLEASVRMLAGDTSVVDLASERRKRA